MASRMVVKYMLSLVSLGLGLQTPTSVLHEHATLKMVQRYSILLSKLYEVVLVRRHIRHVYMPITINASSEDTIDLHVCAGI